LAGRAHAQRAPASRPHRLAAADLGRLRAACGRDRVDLTRSLFRPNSATWRVNREAALLLGGGRALLMQVAHPLVAAGVAEHSDFRTAPLARLWRTLDLVLTITFADAAQAIRAVRAIERVAAGSRPTSGRFGAGRRTMPTTRVCSWVHATLVDSALLAYETFVAPLNGREKRRFYQESKTVARLFGIPEAMIPRTWRQFRTYVGRMIESETLAVGPASRAIADSILRPPLAPGLRHAVRAFSFVTVELLPPRLRQRYGLSSARAQRIMLAGLARTTQTVLRLLPPSLRSLPHATGGLDRAR
jgi:uncharacterized protein (DUF2236 family)